VEVWPESSSADTAARSLYRRSLKLALDWAVHRNIWRGQAVYIRSLFEKNRDVTDPRLQRVRNMAANATGRQTILKDWEAD
jgi:NADH dehydrogenase (ubiquinone) 1 beta subcomplex subunit 9